MTRQVISACWSVDFCIFLFDIFGLTAFSFLWILLIAVMHIISATEQLYLHAKRHSDFCINQRTCADKLQFL